MAALMQGAIAPRFKAQLLGGETFSFGADACCLLAFFKVNCPTCQYTFPFLERLYQNKLQAHPGDPGARVQIYGISQNSAEETLAFADRFAITFPVLLDDTHGFPVSNAYGITNVPTLFLISSAGQIEFTSVGWSRDHMETLNSRLTNLSDGTPIPLFRAGEEVLSFKAG